MNLTHEQMENIGVRYVLELLEPRSAYGREKLRKLRPVAPGDRDALCRALDNVEKTLAARPACQKEFSRIEQVFRQVKNIRKSILSAGTGVLSEVELFEVKRFLIQLKEIKPLFDQINAVARYDGIAFAETEQALALLDPDGGGIATFHLSSRYSAQLAAVRREKQAVEQLLREAQGAQHDVLLEQRREIAAREQVQEDAVRERLSASLRPYVNTLIYNIDAVAELDLTIAKAALARARDAVRPDIDAEHPAFENAVNPLVADALARQSGDFTPISMELARGTTVITGANMGGKSVALKTAALNLYLAQCGLYVFAQKLGTPLFDEMFLVSEDLEAVDRGLSSFGGEIVRFNEIAGKIGEGRCLVLLDEFARGTNPGEGAAIARAVADWLNRPDVVAVMTTHYDGVAAAAAAHYQVRGLEGVDMRRLKERMDTLPQSGRVGLIAQVMHYGLYRVGRTKTVSRDALKVCELLSLDKEIINMAKKTIDIGKKDE